MKLIDFSSSKLNIFNDKFKSVANAGLLIDGLIVNTGFVNNTFITLVPAV